MALVILAHPNYAHSIANKTIINALVSHLPDIEIRDIHALYSDYQIDVDEEQQALLRHDLIILQYPLYWFNMPAIMKSWFDQVFTYQFAYGSKGDKLKNKQILLSLTIGQPEQNFIEDKFNLLNHYLSPVKKSVEYAQMQYLQPLFLYDVSPVSGHSINDITQNAIKQSSRLISVIKQHYLST